jgi:hypothetical protein
MIHVPRRQPGDLKRTPSPRPPLPGIPYRAPPPGHRLPGTASRALPPGHRLPGTASQHPRAPRAARHAPAQELELPPDPTPHQSHPVPPSSRDDPYLRPAAAPAPPAPPARTTCAPRPHHPTPPPHLPTTPPPHLPTSPPPRAPCAAPPAPARPATCSEQVHGWKLFHPTNPERHVPRAAPPAPGPPATSPGTACQACDTRPSATREPLSAEDARARPGPARSQLHNSCQVSRAHHASCTA